MMHVLKSLTFVEKSRCGKIKFKVEKPFGKYVLLGRIGGGGMAELSRWSRTHGKLGYNFAVKFGGTCR